MKVLPRLRAKRRTPRIKLIPLLLSFAVPGVSAGAESDTIAGSTVKGYNCLFMGHSFFAPIAKAFAAHPDRSGVRGHRQTVVFHRGKNGAPGMLWKDTEDDMLAARELLQTGNVDLLGLTYYDAESDLSDYRRWVDFALKYNPDTRFVIQAPWPRYQSRSLAAYEKAAEAFSTTVHQRIDELRKAYPNTVFLCIPQGRWMVELWHLYEKGELPEVVGVMGSDPGYLFRDELGHGGQFAIEMGALLWLAVIYQVDLNAYEWKTHTKFNLKNMAQEIVQHDPCCGLKPPSTGPSAPTTP